MSSMVFFDVDGVLIKEQTQKLLIRYLLEKKKLPFHLFLKVSCWFALYKIGLVRDVFKIRIMAFKHFKGWDINEARKTFKDFFEKEIKRRINSGAVGIINNHIEKGDKVILVSASLKEIIDILREYLGLEFAIYTELETDNNFYTGNISGMVPYGEYKIKKIYEFLKEEGYSLGNSWAYCDHISDLPLLQIVSNPRVVNPDRRLRRIAREKGWPIYELR